MAEEAVVMRVRWLPTVLLSAAVGAVAALSVLFGAPLLRDEALVVVPAPAEKISSQPEALPPPRQAQAPPAPQGKGVPAPAAASKSEARNEPWPIALAGKWPLALLLALLLVAASSRLRRVLGAGSKLVRRVSAAGVEMEISSEAADEVKQHLRASFRELVANARDEYERMADVQQIDSRLAAIFEEHVRKQFNNAKGLRATIHVPDIIFSGYLYQLIDYYPAGGGAHRRFSQRYGIIGRSWRSGKSHGTGNAFESAQGKEETLVEEWGMTRQEAHGKLNAKPSCLSVLLRCEGVPVGILYVDSDTTNAFGVSDAANRLAKDLESKPSIVELTKAVDRTLAPLRSAAPNLDIKKLG